MTYLSDTIAATDRRIDMHPAITREEYWRLVTAAVQGSMSNPVNGSCTYSYDIDIRVQECIRGVSLALNNQGVYVIEHE